MQKLITLCHSSSKTVWQGETVNSDVQIYFRQSFRGTISKPAECIEIQLMPDESSGKDLQIRLRSLYVRLLLHGVFLLENVLNFTDDLDLSRSQPCKITFWAITRFLLDKLSPHFNTAELGFGPFTKLKNILKGLNL